MVRDIQDYSHSSYRDYLGSGSAHFTDTSFVLSIIGQEEFILFHAQMGSERCLDTIERRVLLTDEQARAVILELLECKSAVDLQKLDRGARNEALKKLRAQGISIRQLSRLTGISKSVIEKQ